MPQYLRTKIKELLNQTPALSVEAKATVQQFIPTATEEQLQQLLHFLVAEDTARTKILELNAGDLDTLTATIIEENQDILTTFSGLIEQAEQENQPTAG